VSDMFRNTEFFVFKKVGQYGPYTVCYLTSPAGSGAAHFHSAVNPKIIK